MSAREFPRKLIAEGANGVSVGVRNMGAAWKVAKTFIDKEQQQRRHKIPARHLRRLRRHGPRRAPLHIARGVVSISALFSFTFAMLPVYCIATSLRAKSHASLALFYLRTLNRILNVRVHVIGKPRGAGPFFLAANHASWLDIPVLGSIFPMDFMALANLQDYHGFGFMARQGRSQFVSGVQGRGLVSERAVLEAHLRAGKNMTFFPEAMIGNGNSLYGFRSSFMGMTTEQGEPIAAIPVSIAYACAHGMPMSRKTRSSFSWRGNCPVSTTIWNAACLGAMDVVVEFHPPLADESGKTRKEIAHHCQRSCARGLAYGLHRWTPPWQRDDGKTRNRRAMHGGFIP